MTSFPEPAEWPLVYIVVLNWNQCEMTLECLASLAELDYPHYEVVVVDNGSRDGSPSVIHERFPEARVIENSENLGFVEGNNVGIRRALQQGADYVLLLNNDTVVDPQMLTALISVAESDTQIGIVGPLIYYYDQPETIWNAGNMVDWRAGESRPSCVDEQDGDVLTSYEVDYVAGCALCIKRQVIERIGLMDPRCFFYCEDTDWCLRGWAEGYRVVVVLQACIWHRVSATIGYDSPAATYYMTRNEFLLLWKNLRGVKRIAAIANAAYRHLRTVAAHTVKKRHRHLRANRNARLLALRDAALGRFGKMGPDVTAICYPDQPITLREAFA